MNAAAVYPVKINWARLMTELRSAGWTPYKVAGTLCADHPTAYAWANGSEPSHSYGAALLRLHQTICGQEASIKLHSDSLPRA